MSGHEQDVHSVVTIQGRAASAGRRPTERTLQAYGTIIVVGGGCYGSYYVRQLGRARRAAALSWEKLIVVDRDPGCRVVSEPQSDSPDVVTSDWSAFFARYLGASAENAPAAARDAIVPSPLMPHLLFDWLVTRARERYQRRDVAVRPLAAAPAVPWQRVSDSGDTHYVSFAEWMCPINCVEPIRCPVTRGARDWTMPAALHAHVVAERAGGHFLHGPLVFHCVHRAFGVGMIDVRDVIDADRQLATVADHGAADFLVGTVSHCHGALGVLSVGAA